MARKKTLFQCTECGGETSKWQGQCPFCGQWNTLLEIDRPIKSINTHRFQAWSSDKSGIQLLSEIKAEQKKRCSIGIGEWDKVLGGGLVKGSVTLLGGDPGVGKSTLFLQVLSSLAEQGQKVLYVSGEESGEQVSLRARRMGLTVQGIKILAEINLERIIHEIKQAQPAFVVIDSIQTIYLPDLSAAPGSVSQVRECAARLTRLAKETGISVLFVGHVTKDGAIAGPRVLEHMVDTVLYFEGESNSNFRMIRAIKNRFGAANELGIFAMMEKGLVGVLNPSAIFLSSYRSGLAGSSVLVTQEGTRPLLVEIQALVAQAQGPNPQRLTVGLGQNRLSMLLAVLSKHAGIDTLNQDIFVNAVGGVKIVEPASDLAVVLAICSSFKNQNLREKMIVFGEIGLLGELRPVQKGQERLKEAEKLGFRYAIIPTANQPKDPSAFPHLRIEGVQTVAEALEKSWDF